MKNEFTCQYHKKGDEHVCRCQCHEEGSKMKHIVNCCYRCTTCKQRIKRQAWSWDK